MPKKAFPLIFITLITWLFMAACQPKSAISEIDCGKAEVLCVGLVTGLDGVNDHSINELAWEGVQQARAEKIVDWVKFIETVDAKDYYLNISSLAAAGYDIIVTVGEDNSEVTSLAANKFPEIQFIGVDQDQTETLPNSTGLVFRNDQTGFLAGALAAQVTKTGTIAGIFGADLDPTISAYKEGFAAGARYINPNINIITTYHPVDQDSVINDAEWGAISASQVIQNGADVVFGAGDKISYGALLEASRHSGLYCIGINYDQWETFPEARSCLLSSAMRQVNQGVFAILKLARDGNFPSGNYIGTSGLAPYHDFENAIPQEVKEQITSITGGLANKTITTGVVSP